MHSRPSRLSLPILLVALATSVVAEDEVNPGWWAHYARASAGCGIGAVLGLGFGFVATLGAESEHQASSGIGASVLGGSVLGSAYAANTITPWHESEGSFGLDVVGATGTAIAFGYAGMEAAGLLPGNMRDGVRTGVVFATIAAVPLGSVWMQRWVAGSPPEIGLWVPERPSRAVGLMATWRLPR